MIMKLVIPLQLTYVLISSHFSAASLARWKSFRLQSARKDSASSDFLCSKLFFQNGKGQQRKRIKNSLNAAKWKSSDDEAHYMENGDFEKCDHLHELGQSAARRIKWFLFISYAKSLFVGLFSRSMVIRRPLMSYDVDVSFFRRY